MLGKMNKRDTVIAYIVLVVIAALMLIPLLWMLSASLKNSSEVFAFPFKWIPEVFYWENYSKVFERIPMFLFIKNSAKLTIIVTAIQLFTSSFAAYGFAKCQFKGRDLLFLAYVATIAIPWQVYMLPQYVIIQKLHLVDTHLGYILLQAFIAFGVFLMRSFYLSIPDELLEAARIDGLSEYGNFFKIALPMAKPAMASLLIFSFVTIWNDYMGPMIYFNSTAVKTVPLGIKMFVGQYSADYNLIMAASMISLIPIFIVFIAFQRFFVEGIATNGLKG